MRRWIALLLALTCLCPAAALAEAPAETDPSGEAQQAEALDPATLAPGYVFVSAATVQGWLPLPTEGEVSFPLAQTLPDGTEALNVIHLTPHGVWMEDSTCEGHDCVEQGEVTLENRDSRLLCLPNQVSLELYSTEELLALMGAQTETAGGDETP